MGTFFKIGCGNGHRTGITLTCQCAPLMVDFIVLEKRGIILKKICSNGGLFVIIGVASSFSAFHE